MEKVIHRSVSRGVADHGWLKTYSTFSYGNYYDPRRIHFGALRVINDNTLQGGKGFGSHPHDNMEIITVIASGSLEHGDNIGNVWTISKGDVQVLSAGTGMIHNEYNKSAETPARFLEIWIFPKEYELKPGYSRATYGSPGRNELKLVAAPLGDGDESTAEINQNTWFYLTEMDSGVTVSHELHDKANGVYVYIFEGEVDIDGTALSEGDGMGITDALSVSVTAGRFSKVLLVEIPMRR